MAYGQKTSEHAFQTFHRDLAEGNFPPVLFMYGKEEYLIDWAVRSLVTKYTDEAMRELDFVRLSEDNYTVYSILEACESLCSFSEKKIVWARDFLPLLKKNARGMGESERDELMRYLETPCEQSILVFSASHPEEGATLVKELKKRCRCYDFSSLDMAQLSAFALKRFKAAGADISRPVLKYFIDESGYFNRDSEYRLYNLINDIDKVAAYCGGGPITQEAVSETLHGDLDTFAFNFLDAALSGRKDKAFRLLHNMMARDSEIYSIIGLLVNQFELMCECRELAGRGLSAEQIAKELKANAYRVKKASAAAQRMSDAKLLGILSQLYELDRQIKTGAMEQKLALEMMIGRI